MGDPSSGNGSKKGSNPGPSLPIKVLYSLLKRFDSLLRARAKVYSSTRSDPNPQGATQFGAPRVPGRPHFWGSKYGKIPHFAVVWVPDPRPRSDQKWSKSGPKVVHFGVPGGPNPGFRTPNLGFQTPNRAISGVPTHEIGPFGPTFNVDKANRAIWGGPRYPHLGCDKADLGYLGPFRASPKGA